MCVYMYVCVFVYTCVCVHMHAWHVCSGQCRYLACALILRGKVDVSDIRRNIDRFLFVFIMG